MSIVEPLVPKAQSFFDTRVAYLELRVVELERVLGIVMFYIDEGARQHIPLRRWNSVRFFEAETDSMARCMGCNDTNQNRLRPCGRCFSARYCSEECQQSHWSKEHSRQCIQTLPDPSPFPPLPLDEELPEKE